MGRRKKRLWSDAEKHEICRRTGVPGMSVMSVAPVGRRYAMNANLIFDRLEPSLFWWTGHSRGSELARLQPSEGARWVRFYGGLGRALFPDEPDPTYGEHWRRTSKPLMTIQHPKRSRP